MVVPSLTSKRDTNKCINCANNISSQRINNNRYLRRVRTHHIRKSADYYVMTPSHKWTDEVLRAISADGDGDRPLHIAVVHEDILLVRKLCSIMRNIGLSVDVGNHLSQTPLHLAVIIGSTHIVEILLEEGASIKETDRHGNTALHLAVKYCKEDCLRLLLKLPLCRSAINSLNYDGFAPIHLAVNNNKIEIVKLLAEANCNINAMDGKSGRTPLLHSVLTNQELMTRILLANKASPLKMDYAGFSPLNSVALTGNKKLTDLILLNVIRKSKT